MEADQEGKKGAAGGGGLESGLEWGLERQFAFEREMLLMADNAAEPQLQKPRAWRQRQRPFAADLLQNCDLPPPAKLFGPATTLQRLESAAGAADETQKSGTGAGDNDDSNTKDSLLRALRLSQSRAREAEEKLSLAGASNGDLAALLVRDAVALSAHRRWVMMLEAENSMLLRQGGEEEEGAAAARSGGGGGGGGVGAWWVALAVCVGIAGVGLALGRFLC